MTKSLIMFSFLMFFTWKSSTAQENTKIYLSEFHPESVTYNGSPNPNECWESVAWGIKIKTEKGSAFFLIGYQAFEELKEKIGDAKVEIEVMYLGEPDFGNGAVGFVTKIVSDGKVLYENK